MLKELKGYGEEDAKQIKEKTKDLCKARKNDLIARREKDIDRRNK